MPQTALRAWTATDAAAPTGPLREAVGLGGARLVAAVGAGGKTSLLHSLGAEAAAAGGRVLLTTTTHLAWEPGAAPDTEQARARLAAGPGVVVAGAPVPDSAGPAAPYGKIAGLGEEALRALGAVADLVLVEADGSRRLPFKVPGRTEPVVPDGADLVLVVAGAHALGRPLGEICPRLPEAAALLPAATPDAPLTVTLAAELLLRGYARHPALAGRRALAVLTHADDPAGRDLARALADALTPELPAVVVGRATQEDRCSAPTTPR